MNSYQSMSVPASASASFAQFYQHAAAASAVSAASAGAIGVDSLGNACTQPTSGVVPTAGAGQTIADLPRYPWMTLTGNPSLNHHLYSYSQKLIHFGDLIYYLL